MKQETVYRCTFTNDYHKVGNRISERDYKSLPNWVWDDYKKIEI